MSQLCVLVVRDDR